MKNAGCDATSALIRALRAYFANVELTLEEVRSRSWASATFVGARHELSLMLSGANAAAEADRFTAQLSLAEFALRGHLLADLVLVGRETAAAGGVRLRLEALTVEDG